MFGIIRSKPWLAVNVVVSAPVCKRAVDGARRAAFGLHLADDGRHAPNILLAFGGPFVSRLTHI